MAFLDTLVAQHFGGDIATDDVETIALELDAAIYSAGKIAQTIRLLASSEDAPDIDQIEALAQSQLALLGQTGPLIDKLAAYATTIAAAKRGD